MFIEIVLIIYSDNSSKIFANAEKKLKKSDTYGFTPSKSIYEKI
jgi:hypothetical protein